MGTTPGRAEAQPGPAAKSEIPQGGIMPDRASTVLITGATSGHGRYLARQLARSGWIGFGGPGAHRQVSQDGHELRFAVNYLAPVLLTRLLVPLLTASAPSRIVNVGSIGQIGFDPHDAEFEHGYNGTDAYRRAKLALAAFTFDLAGELRDAKVTVNCLHPATFMNTAMVIEGGVTPLSTVAEGGTATLRLITDPALDGVTGEFFNGQAAARALPEAYDDRFRRDLREVTGAMLG